MTDAPAKRSWLQRTVIPVLLVVLCPPFVMVLWFTNAYLEGSFLHLGTYIQSNGIGSLLQAAWFSRFLGTPASWGIILVFAFLQLLLMKILPGRIYEGSRTPNNDLPKYRNNGVLSYLTTLALFFLGGSLGWFRFSVVYDHFGDILATLNITALVFCIFLYFKGRFAPSSADSGTSGSPVFDYYWGTELHPRILGWDVKMFTNCRFGMTGWALSVLSFAFAQKNMLGAFNYGTLVSALLIAVYLLKFFIWESGYMRSMDIQVDRAGFYICWGCLVWVPALYTLPVYYMVTHPSTLSLAASLGLFLLGNIAIFTNFWADMQRKTVRETQGNCKIFGRPPRLIHAEYTTADGTKAQNILLASGFWGVSRHFHYIPELSAAFIWSVASGFSNIMPFLYILFLAILLVHRSIRDDKKCSLKYGSCWQEYRELVPYKLIPFLF